MWAVPCGILKVTEAEAMNDEELIRGFESIEKKVDATASLVRVGLPTLTGLDTKVNGLIDSQVRLYYSVQHLSEKLQILADAQAITEQKVQAIAAAQAATERKLQILSDAQTTTEQKLQLLIDTLKQSRNGGSAPEVSN
jgi:hypothetical protein